MDDIAQFKESFFQECEELLGGLETHLMALKDGGTDEELLHAAFRAIHSIKGGAGLFGFDRLIAFAHMFEAVLDLMRSGRIALTEDTIAAALRAGDVLADLIRAARDKEELKEGYEDAATTELATATGIDPRDLLEGKAGDDLDPAQSAARPEGGGNLVPTAGEETGRVSYCIGFRPHSGMLQRNNEPLLLARQLKELGELTVTADLSALPAFEELDPTTTYLAWAFELETNASRAEVEEIFEFVEDECDLIITDRAGVAAVGEVPEAQVKTEQSGDSTAAPAANEGKAPGTASKTAQEDSTRLINSIRVDVDRIDRLVNMVGEIVIAQSMVTQRIDQRLIESDPALVQGLQQLLLHTQSLQDSVMSIRAQPVRTIFARIPRLVRDLASQTGKKIRVEMIGESTELDKTVIEQLNDPLTHMIRNSVDHGIEPIEERVAQGKRPEATIHLMAEQRGGRIVIEISDDGRGLDREKVRQRAIERKLISADAVLTNEEADNLIFLPGFSTVDTVTSLSGRGVGMDVVKQNIQKLGGRVSLRTEPGQGSNIVLTLPLTLAVLDGMIIRAGSETFVIPTSTIIQSLLPRQDDITRVTGSGDVLKFRGEYIALLSLDQVFDIAPDDGSASKLAVVVEVEGGTQIAIAVDEIIGQQQIVIKSLEENFDPLPGFAGATILGNGEVGLILDVTAVHELHKPHDPHRPGPRDGRNSLQERAA